MGNTSVTSIAKTVSENCSKLIKTDYWTLVALAFTSISVPVMAHNEKSSQKALDARLEHQILTTYQLSPYLRYDVITVKVQNGAATISGRVENEVNKELAAKIAEGVNGISTVKNSMSTEAYYKKPEGKYSSSYSAMLNDASITAAVTSKLVWSRNVDSNTTNVATKLGIVTLTGTAETQAAVKLASDLAMTTAGVASVDNKLLVRANPDGKKKNGTTLADSWLTTKVKSTFIYSTNVDSLAITVKTHHGIVTLNGTVETGSEKALAVQLAENVRGVQSVNAAGLVLK